MKCPLKMARQYQQGDVEGECEEGKCAWWAPLETDDLARKDGITGMCCIRMIAMELGNINLIDK